MLTNPFKRSASVSALTLVGLCLLYGCGSSNDSGVTNPKTEKLKLQPGFVAEHLYSPSDNEHGSWVSMAFDDKGRLITSDQYGGLYRTIIPEIGSKDSVKVEKLAISWDKDSLVMGHAQGLLYAFNSLYVVINNRPNPNFNTNSGVYRLFDTDGDDQFDKITTIREFDGSGEHGPHSIILSPDGQSLFVIAGNHTDLPKVDTYTLPNNWGDDNLFPLIKDPRGHANDRHAPGGWIVNIDPEGKNWKLVSAGYRNPYDLAFNEAGDLFVYDADMEWDFGQPWYRPTRINHATSGSEFGWRTGDQKWASAYPDNLPAISNIGHGSPTNLMYVNKARFPEKYRNTLFAFDWSFGIVHALKLIPDGASYKTEHEEFLSGVPLPLTDGVIGPDGALYFMTGGRRLASDVYRVYHKDYKSIQADANVVPAERTEAGKLRVSLEQYHGKKDPAAVGSAWPNLGHADRYIRYAARIAVENQPVEEWRGKVGEEQNAATTIQALLALARQGNKADLKLIIDKALAINFESLSLEQKIDLLRTIEVALYRHGMPAGAEKAALTSALDSKYPSNSTNQNKLLVKILVYLQSPTVIEKTLALMTQDEKPDAMELDMEYATSSSELVLRNPQYGLDIASMLAEMPSPQHTFYAIALSQQKSGWTEETRNQYFSWYNKAFDFKGGRSYVGFLDKARKIALANLPKSDLEKFDKLSGGEKLSTSGNDLVGQYAIKGPGRRWTIEQADSVITAESIKGRDFETGKLIYHAVLCSKCHAIAGEGENAGPDLTQLATRFSSKDILDAIIDPNKAISDQYAANVFSYKNGGSIVGKLANEDATHYYVAQNPFTPNELEKVAKKDVSSITYSTVSMMLPGLINGLNPEELKDLMAFLVAGGNKENAIYKK
jgi:putative heme-binding domain-containing protein